MSIEVAGADGCRGGWAIARLFVHSKEVQFYLVKSLEAFVQVCPAIKVLVVDMPIILGSRPEQGGRPCDREARRFLGRPAGSSVFSPPTSSTLIKSRQGASYRQLHEAQRAVSLKAPGLSKQTYFLLPKIDEVDVFVRRHPDLTVVEGHPEVAWKVRRLWERQTFLSKKTQAGRAARERWVRGQYGRTSLFLKSEGAGPRAAIDDWLDALVLADVAAAHLHDPNRYFGSKIFTENINLGRIYY